MKDRIISIEAMEILDSRGNPTIRTRVSLENGVCGTASVPSGAVSYTHLPLPTSDLV